MLSPVPNLKDLVADPAKVSQLPAEAIPGLLGELERLKAILWVRLTVPQDGAERTSNGDRLLDVKEACQKLGVKKYYLYRNADRMPFRPFTVWVGKNQVRFSEQGIERFIKAKSRAGQKI
jgi:predicted DNA-binding transcriptional regulator AlpA